MLPIIIIIYVYNNLLFICDYYNMYTVIVNMTVIIAIIN